MRLFRNSVARTYRLFIGRRGQDWAVVALVIPAVLSLKAGPFEQLVHGVMLVACLAQVFFGFDPLKIVSIVVLAALPVIWFPMTAVSSVQRYFIPLQSLCRSQLGYGPEIIFPVIALILILLLMLTLHWICGRPSWALTWFRRLVMWAPIPVVFVFFGLDRSNPHVIWALIVCAIFLFGLYAALLDYLLSADRRAFHWSHLAFFYPIATAGGYSVLRFPAYLEPIRAKGRRRRAYLWSLGLHTLMIAFTLRQALELFHLWMPYQHNQLFWGGGWRQATPNQLRGLLIFMPIWAASTAAIHMMSLIGYFRFLGFHLPISPNAPWRATNFADIYRRLYFNYTQFIFDHFYFPIFTRLPRMPKLWRIGIAIFLSMFLGTFSYHMARTGLPYVALAGSQPLGLLSFVFYLFVFACIFAAQLPFAHRLGTVPWYRRVLNWIVFILVYGALLFFRPSFVSTDPWANFKMFGRLFQ